MPHKHVETSQTGFQGVPHEEYNHFKLHRLNETLPTDKSHYLLATFVEFHVGEPIPLHYHGPTVGYIIEGELHGEDQAKPGEIIKLVAGDVVHVDHESDYIWNSPNKCRVFAVSYAPSNFHPEDYVIKK